jgi:hypothetical protein
MIIMGASAQAAGRRRPGRARGTATGDWQRPPSQPNGERRLRPPPPRARRRVTANRSPGLPDGASEPCSLAGCHGHGHGPVAGRADLECPSPESPRARCRRRRRAAGRRDSGGPSSGRSGRHPKFAGRGRRPRPPLTQTPRRTETVTGATASPTARLGARARRRGRTGLQCSRLAAIPTPRISDSDCPAIPTRRVPGRVSLRLFPGHWQRAVRRPGRPPPPPPRPAGAAASRRPHRSRRAPAAAAAGRRRGRRGGPRPGRPLTPQSYGVTVTVSAAAAAGPHPY